MFQQAPNGNIVFALMNIKLPLEGFMRDEPDYRGLAPEPSNSTAEIPDGFIGRSYAPGKMHFLYTHNTAVPQSLEWAEGDTYIEHADLYRQAQEVRMLTVQDVGLPDMVSVPVAKDHFVLGALREELAGIPGLLTCVEKDNGVTAWLDAGATDAAQVEARAVIEAHSPAYLSVDKNVVNGDGVDAVEVTVYLPYGEIGGSVTVTVNGAAVGTATLDNDLQGRIEIAPTGESATVLDIGVETYAHESAMIVIG